ncbi:MULTISPECIES: radical SAM/SPASM domain-containing protein [Bacillus cereus group]|uniref:radical SAM/SPASM domain-containing protein n=1 Tax=Bacillus cereus group TaxID=86661 RepID=UPI000BEE6FF1|nr:MULTISPECIES: radical SAM protein [Bacillus cereus group]MCC6082890.1 radical SAM protein [Bacillus thuringiensis]PEB13068.1 radical SAM/SPASM domain-containing protein [Bacillus thuringiensis]PEB57431.1 radical SAM/SPASM domain-containing protein [Bacillus cereus]PEB67777.1 radical SAM/SPASM domain-containing protein [Bacillus thuringiensis]PEB87119.1 radical SAM/SPASM domain-containing protein [Bacillus thuringiensis]
MENWKKSRFNALSKTYDGQIILYNSFTGAIGVVPDEENQTVVELLKKEKIKNEEIENKDLWDALVENGFLVPFETNEDKNAIEQRKEYFDQDKTLFLIILPTEQCNFRCTYCYESFLKGRMKPEVIEGIKNFITSRVKSIDTLIIEWFGGEPTEALDVIYDLSKYIIDECDRNNVKYYARMTTNGYNLTPVVFQKLVEECRVTAYQITVDGNKDSHDKTRISKEGKSTYNRIMSNIENFRKHDFSFTVTIRCNFNQENAHYVNLLLNELKEKLKDDERFNINFHAVGKWGGENDEDLVVCTGREASVIQSQLYDEANQKGFNKNQTVMKNLLNPGASVCYAAKPWSLVIGSDGTLYKCTIALYDDRNQIGKLLPNGNLEMDNDKYNLWVNVGASMDEKCGKCFYSPSCQGASCPLKKLDSGISPCPPAKRYIKRTLTTVVGR